MQVEAIVKKYFDNAVIVDDQFNFTEIELPEIADEEIGDIPDEFLVDDVAVTSEHDLNQRPKELFQQLTFDGFIAYPYKYSSQSVEVQLRFLSKVLDTTKLLFIDWNLEDLRPESPEKPGKAAIEILNHYTSRLVGLKCAVIYTQEDCDVVLSEISTHFEVIDGQNYFFQEAGKTEGNSLFGFVMKKDTEPAELIKKISQILLNDKCIPIHIMDSASRLEMSITKAIHKFNAPFEQVLLTQILSSEIKNEGIPKFLDDTLLSSILSDELALQPSNFLFNAKKNRIMKALSADSIDIQKITDFFEILNFKGKQAIIDLFKNSRFVEGLKKSFDDEEIVSFESLKTAILSILPDPSAKNKINEIVLMIFLIVDFIDDSKGFKPSFLEQTYYFTKLLKYVDTAMDKIHTGSIFKRNADDTYLLCITPFCDTHRPDTKVNNIFKFIVGVVVGSDKDMLKNSNDNFACTGVPFDEDKAVKFIKWDFYHVVSLKKEEVFSDCEKMATLRKEYIQNIINRYISYQARAGVNELFFKETYRESFYNVFN